MSKMNVGVLFGGKNSEHEVSRMSVCTVIEGLSEEKYNIFMLGINRRGEWSLYSGDIERIKDGTWENDVHNKRAVISPDAGTRGLVIFDDDSKYEIVKLDVVIPVLHGKNGEDGTIQGLVTLADIPIVGCGVTASATCMDKVITHTLLMYSGVSQVDFYWFYTYDFYNDIEKYVREIEKNINSYPMFVKPANGGSSVGISKVNNKNELVKAIEVAGKEDIKIVIERAIVGREIECAVYGNSVPFVSVPGEVIPTSTFYDYDDKYINGTAQVKVPAQLSQEVIEELQSEVKKAYRILGCTGMARIDSFVEEGTNKVYINEINTIPGFTSISMYPKMMEYSGYSLEKLLDGLIDYAIEAHTDSSTKGSVWRNSSDK